MYCIILECIWPCVTSVKTVTRFSTKLKVLDEFKRSLKWGALRVKEVGQRVKNHFHHIDH